MIYFVLKKTYRFCVAALREDFGHPLPPIEVLAYEDFFRTSCAGPGIYIFCDIERLADNELEAAAEIAALMKDKPGFRVLNDPARVRTRYAFLRAMREAGLNDFDAYRADGFPRPQNFPVFVRSEASHRAPITDLIADQSQLDQALSDMRVNAQPLRGLIVIEFCAQPVVGGIWRRHATFKIDDNVYLHDIVSERNWNVKYGERGLVDETTYAADLKKTVSNFMSEKIRQAFEIAAIDYGRADFGFFQGRPQVYEINTNPYIRQPLPHHSPSRTQATAFAQKKLAEAFVSVSKTIDPTMGRPVLLKGTRIDVVRRERHRLG